MKTIGVRGLREHPGLLSQCAEKGEYLVITNRNEPLSLSVPFNDELINAGVHVSMAVALYEQGILTLTKAARLAKIPVESFLKKLAALGVVVVNQSADELASDLQNIE